MAGKAARSGDYATARILLMRGRYKEALKELRLILRRNPKDVDALYQLARLRLEMGNASRSRKAFGRCARLDSRGKWTKEIVTHLKKLD